MPEDAPQPEGPALDALPDSLEAAQAEHAQIMQRLNEARQFIETGTRRGIFLEGVIKAMTRPNRATRRAAGKKAG